MERFVAVAKHGSVNRAAEALSVSQPSLSRSLQMLEERVGTPLFVRGARGVALTPAGVALLPHARLVLVEQERAIKAVHLASGEGIETLSIGTDACFASHTLPRGLAALAKSRPKVRVRVQEGSIQDLLAGLNEGCFDLVFGARRVDLDIGELGFEKLAMERAALIFRPDHPLARKAYLHLADLLESQWIVPDHPELLEGWSSLFKAQGLAVPTAPLQSSSLHVIKGCLLAGPFISFGDISSFTVELSSGRLISRDLSAARYERPAGVFYRKQGRRSPTQNALINAMRR